MIGNTNMTQRIRTLRIQLTDECNLNCVYCCNEGTKNDYSIIKNTNLIRFIHACYDVLGIKRVKLTGGEPLEYDESISDLIKNVNRKGIDFSIVTNATDYSKFSSLLDKSPELEVTISLPVPINKEYRLKYVDTYKKITGALDAHTAFGNAIKCIDYMNSKNKPFKINYVLCKGINTSDEFIKEMIEYANENSNIRLRFLETVVNATNNSNNRMNRFIFPCRDFEQILKNLGYADAVNNKINDTRSISEYKLNNSLVKLIKFFCNNSCNECPSDKTSLWLTSTGAIKTCSFLASSSMIKNWQYAKIAEQLTRDVLSNM